jgi:hypothetical protein
MKVKQVMSVNPACCTPNNAQHVAKLMCDLNVGVVVDHQSRAGGMIRDRDLRLNDRFGSVGALTRGGVPAKGRKHEHGAGNVGRIERLACETRESAFKQKL